MTNAQETLNSPPTLTDDSPVIDDLFSLLPIPSSKTINSLSPFANNFPSISPEISYSTPPSQIVDLPSLQSSNPFDDLFSPVSPPNLNFSNPTSPKLDPVNKNPTESQPFNASDTEENTSQFDMSVLYEWFQNNFLSTSEEISQLGSIFSQIDIGNSINTNQAAATNLERVSTQPIQSDNTISSNPNSSDDSNRSFTPSSEIEIVSDPKGLKIRNEGLSSTSKRTVSVADLSRSFVFEPKKFREGDIDALDLSDACKEMNQMHHSRDSVTTNKSSDSFTTSPIGSTTTKSAAQTSTNIVSQSKIDAQGAVSNGDGKQSQTKTKPTSNSKSKVDNLELLTLAASTASKPFKCPHKGCAKSYKQKSGLSYHLSKAHQNTSTSTDPNQALDFANFMTLIPPSGNYSTIPIFPLHSNFAGPPPQIMPDSESAPPPNTTPPSFRLDPFLSVNFPFFPTALLPPQFANSFLIPPQLDNTLSKIPPQLLSTFTPRNSEIFSQQKLSDITEAGASISAEKPYWCRIKGCLKKYKNLNGLRYHLIHAHRKYLLSNRFNSRFDETEIDCSLMDNTDGSTKSTEEQSMLIAERVKIILKDSKLNGAMLAEFQKACERELKGSLDNSVQSDEKLKK
ncbi:hypothetical protein HK098_006910 [Nowakowskiella sp. JEL0407]|nr:hypothetical protein HK098_006910 [Nowakowskiella sp. JEL0407]